MKLSAKERVSLRAMSEFARHYGGGPISLHEIARTQDLPMSYLEHVVSILRRAGLLASVRGAHGGYSLARDPATISVGDVFRAVEGSLVTLDCMRTGACDREPMCETRSVWQSVAARLAETLDGMALTDILHGDAEALTSAKGRQADVGTNS